ncbi:hypothetical protein HMN09_00209100 [Mycena chlorophos]|uniref:Uncharacterized protein n=1 Tax=Mycena chlorophos TaxID=658473 RepID=A0A8H6TSZ9_MYCCL|nr:hypothetical protein HMN09_00209100 [Mycena chlorophos]
MHIRAASMLVCFAAAALAVPLQRRTSLEAPTKRSALLDTRAVDFDDPEFSVGSLFERDNVLSVDLSSAPTDSDTDSDLQFTDGESVSDFSADTGSIASSGQDVSIDTETSSIDSDGSLSAAEDGDVPVSGFNITLTLLPGETSIPFITPPVATATA